MKIPGNKIFFWLTLIGFIVLVLGVLFAFVFLSLIIDDQIYRNVRLKEGTDQYERWVNLPLSVYYRLWFFNVTNPDEITNDNAIPVVQEVGPYVYQQTRQKRNIVYNEEEDTLTYTQYLHFEFDAIESYPLTENDTIIMAHPVLNTLFNMVTSYVPEEYQYTVDSLWRYVLPEMETLFQPFRIGEILFDGYRFCDPERLSIADDYSAIICAAFSLISSPMLEIEEDGSVSFAFFKWKQDKHDGVFTINAGNKDVGNLGGLLSWDGHYYMDIWNGRLSTCNKVAGTDGTIFPPFLGEEDVNIFAAELCRVAPARYVGDAEVLEIVGQKRVLKEDIFSLTTNSNNECFCVSTVRDLYGEQKCLPDGFFDLQPCMGAPLVASLPHFLHAEGDYINTVIGLNPNEEKHITYAILEPSTGTPLEGFRRAQFNLMLRPIPGVNISQVRNSLLPILWVEEGVAINEEFADMFKKQFYDLLGIVDIVKWVIIGLGAAMFVSFGGVYLYLLKFN